MKHLAVIAVIMLLPALLSAQTVEYRRADPRLPFDNVSAFERYPASGFWEWSNYIESLDGKQFSIWAVVFTSGILHGMRESYYADPTCFERKWGVSPTSFFGSEAWRRNYWCKDPNNGHKPEYLGNVGRDFWHTSGFAQKTLLVGGTFAIGARKKQPLKIRLLNLAIAIGAQSLAANLAYNHYRP